MSDIPNWDAVTPQIRPIAFEYLESIQDAFNGEYDVSSISDGDADGGIMWDIAITTSDERTLVVSFNVVDSLEYEGEMLGYNISVDAVYEDGEIAVKHTPYNYTDDVWTTDLDELVARAENVPTITPDVIEG